MKREEKREKIPFFSEKRYGERSGRSQRRGELTGRDVSVQQVPIEFGCFIFIFFFSSPLDRRETQSEGGRRRVVDKAKQSIVNYRECSWIHLKTRALSHKAPQSSLLVRSSRIACLGALEVVDNFSLHSLNGRTGRLLIRFDSKSCL